MMEPLAETIRSAKLAIEHARLTIEMARRVLDVAQHERLRAASLREEAKRLHASARYNRPR